MQLAIDNTPITTTGPISFSRKALWAGRAVSALPVLFLLMDGIMKIFPPEIVVKATLDLGYRESVIVPLGLVLVASTILYIVPRTAVLGAILLTGYLGGAVATHVRVGDSTFSMIFPVIVGSLLWLGLYLRDERMRALVPVRS
jgi:hypothetical protein